MYIPANDAPFKWNRLLSQRRLDMEEMSQIWGKNYSLNNTIYIFIMYTKKNTLGGGRTHDLGFIRPTL